MFDCGDRVFLFEGSRPLCWHRKFAKINLKKPKSLWENVLWSCGQMSLKQSFLVTHIILLFAENEMRPWKKKKNTVHIATRKPNNMQKCCRLELGLRWTDRKLKSVLWFSGGVVCSKHLEESGSHTRAECETLYCARTNHISKPKQALKISWILNSI